LPPGGCRLDPPPPQPGIRGARVYNFSEVGGAVANNLRIVSMGDSVLWGQGLLPNQKVGWLVQQALLPSYPGGVTFESLAHSGAVIGASGASGSPQPGEVPAARLSALEQCGQYANSPRPWTWCF